MPRKRKPIDPATQPDHVNDDGLTPKQADFVVAYEALGQNATKAWLQLHPNCKNKGTAATEGYRTLKLPQVQAVIQRERTARWKRLRMQGDEALAYISVRARASYQDLYDEKGALRPAKDWPKWLFACIKSIKPGPFGDTIVFYDALEASKVMAAAAGVLKTNLNVLHTFDHRTLLAMKDE